MQRNSEVLNGLVVGHKRDGRCRYDPQVKQELVRQCMMPGVSVARMAMQHGINANLLRSWITKSQSGNTVAVQRAVCETVVRGAQAFVPVQVEAGASCAAIAMSAKAGGAQSEPIKNQPEKYLQNTSFIGVQKELFERQFDQKTQ